MAGTVYRYEKESDMTEDNIHPELRRLSGLFDVPYTPIQEDIGLRVYFVAPTCPAEYDAFTIVAIQRNHAGELVYRVVGDNDEHKFGRVARVIDLAVETSEDNQVARAKYVREQIEKITDEYSRQSQNLG